MLVRSGLDSREQAAVMATTGGSLEVKIIREKLITMWEDDDLAERDGLHLARYGPDTDPPAASHEYSDPRDEESGQMEVEREDFESRMAA